MIVQSSMASAALNSYHIPLNVVMIAQTSNWTMRQWITYWAIKECIRRDFLGLMDWADQITRYSGANPLQLSGPLSVIANNLLSNRLTLTTETSMEGSDIDVGTPLATITGFSQVFTITPDQMADPDVLSNLVG
jgi:hypothetical protein